MKGPPWLKVAVRVFAAVASVLIVFALVRAIKRDWPAAIDAWQKAEINALWIIVAILFGLAAHFLYALGWWRLLKDCAIPFSLWQTTRVYLVSDLGRYLPGGKAWQTGLIAAMAAEYNLPATTVAATSLVVGLVGLATGGAVLLAAGDITLPINRWWLAIPIGCIVALLAAPAALKSMPRLRKKIVSKLFRLDSVTTGTIWMLVWTTGLSWIAWGLGLYALALGLLPDPVASPLTYVAAFIGAFLGGAMAVVAPGGLGVRDELMRTMLTASGLDAGSAIVLILVARLYTTVLDIAPALLFLLFSRPVRARASALRKRGKGSRVSGARVTAKQ